MNGLTELHRFDWNGILLEIIYEPHWLPPAILGEDVAHLKVYSIYPTNVPLPLQNMVFSAARFSLQPSPPLVAR